MPSKIRRSLAQSLDREVYQFVRQILDQNPSRVTAATVYDEIHRSNSSLNRKPRKILEGSVERVLSTIQTDVEEDPVEMSEPSLPTHRDHVPSNGMNRSMVAAWSNSTIMENTNTQSTSEPEPILNGNSATQVNTTSKKRQTNGESLPKRRKLASSTTIDRSPPTHISFADLGGIDSIIEQLDEYIAFPLSAPQIFANSGVQSPRGILIHGPSGCGKTSIANALAAELGVSFISISAPSIVSGMSGESEKLLRDHFEEAKKNAPCLMFIDEIDAITPKRDGAQREMEKRIVAQLMTCMDDLDLRITEGRSVIVLAATTRPDALDPALRRGGRFEKEIIMPVPTEPVREQILRTMLRDCPVEGIDFGVLARQTPGFVGADLKELVSTAGSVAANRVRKACIRDAEASGMDLDTLGVGNDNAAELRPVVASFRRSLQFYARKFAPTNDEAATGLDESEIIRRSMDDFASALARVQPTALREGFATIPSTTFASIGALSTHIEELQSSIIDPILDPESYTSAGLRPVSGALLWGPPGCGKTLLAKAVANSSHANFISVKGPELLNKYVGESERAVRQLFNRARSSIPVIIFFDELDALVPRRDGTSSEASSRVVNMLLTELDGVGSSREGIYIIAATNRPDMIDRAMLRPGRLDTLIYVGLPDAGGRVDIVKTLCRNLKALTWTEEVAAIARECEGFSGADLQMLVTRAGRSALKRHRLEVGTALTITAADFKDAMPSITKSVTTSDMLRYTEMQKEWATY